MATSNPEASLHVGGLILCGGRSTRMGSPKAWLPFGGEPMLVRVLRRLSEVVAPIVVVAAPDQDLPPLPVGTLVARDETEGRGPLAGLHAGLTALATLAEPDRVDAVYATSCDVPLLRAEFVRSMIARLEQNDVAVPVESGRHHPLAAVYRASVAPAVRSLLESDRLRPIFLYDLVKTVRVDVADLRAVDPDLDTLMNLNHPEEYQAALARCGFGTS